MHKSAFSYAQCPVPYAHNGLLLGTKPGFPSTKPAFPVHQTIRPQRMVDDPGTKEDKNNISSDFSDNII
jgi:hypothetical protein